MINTPQMGIVQLPCMWGFSSSTRMILIQWRNRKLKFFTRLTFAVVAGAVISMPSALADDCTPPSRNNGLWNLHLIIPPGAGYEADVEFGRLFQERCGGSIPFVANEHVGSVLHKWHYCKAIANLPSREADWPAFVNFCPNGAVASGSPPPAPAPKKAKACKSKDIERSWTRTSDETNISVVGMGRSVGGSGIMNKSASNRWPRHVAKFFRIKQRGDSCEWAAQCTTIHFNTANKGYNFSTQTCTLALSDDKKQLSASGPHGTFTRGGK